MFFKKKNKTQQKSKQKKTPQYLNTDPSILL